MAELIPTIGIETHVQLKTATKLFSGASNDAREAEPNSLINQIDAGLPGALPVLNQKALELAVRAALALNTKPQKFSKFDRKHYFYPDLPKGYQITQYEDPIIVGGHVELTSGKKVGITRVHLEEDAGKNIHPAGSDYSLVDLNRAGTPLLEIVSQPDIHSAAEAKAYARELWLIMRYADITDGDLYHGHVRFDVNISVSADKNKPGIRTEVKNLNSFRSVENAVAYEIKRQTETIKKGGIVIQETRGWDEAKQKTISQRGKEEAEDYRYMPEPDIPPIELRGTEIRNIESEMPLLPNDFRSRLRGLAISDTELDILIDADSVALPAGGGYLAVLTGLMDKPGVAMFAANWMIHRYFVKSREQLLKEGFTLGPARDTFPTVRQITDIHSLKEKGLISSNSADALMFDFTLGGSFHHENYDPKQIAEKRGYVQVSNESEIEKVVNQVISANSDVVADIKAGKDEAIGFLVGQVMAKTKGQANPSLAQKIIRQKLL